MARDMAPGAGRPLSAHSRRVYWLKVTLPVVALAILSTIFLLARHIDYKDNLPLVRDTLADRVRDPRLTRPDFSGLTADGAAVSLTAAEARPGAGASDPATARGVDMRYAKGDRTLRVTADDGAFDAGQGRMTLTGAAHLATSDGYDLAAPRIVALTGATDVTADGGVTGTAPMGRITAAEMRLTGAPGALQVVFKGGVKLVYSP